MEQELRWNAVITNDARFDGAFFYGVRSTGIFCRPSCRSKPPKRENVDFFNDAASAEAGGFRPCLRCRPKSSEPSPQVRSIIVAAELIESEENPTLESVAAAIGLSPAHFQKLFKEIVGVTPKKYAEGIRIERFKRGVREGEPITDAMYGAGFGSSSRLYEKASERLGMTPRRYSEKGMNMTINYAVADCELGKMLVARTEKGVCSVTFGDEESKLIEDLRNEFSRAEIAPAADGLPEIIEAVIASLEGRERSPDLPLDLRATAFQLRVWDELRKIPYGETVSYLEVAERIGNRNAVRAVARACASNRVALLIPCHRVVKTGGDVSGYRWGVHRKRIILKNEKERAR